MDGKSTVCQYRFEYSVLSHRGRARYCSSGKLLHIPLTSFFDVRVCRPTAEHGLIECSSFCASGFEHMLIITTFTLRKLISTRSRAHKQ
eukprot:5057214-Amphidinium_carterae.1